MSIDTACSSSLVALHQACQSIRRGESSMALVGGVNILLSPFGFIGFSQASMLSPTGRCRAFDAAADGYVRAEGGAFLLLKPLAKAKADGDTIHATILGTGVNTDGHTHGMSLPSTAAQEALLRKVYAESGVDPASVAYLEAHGTGTAAGDPQEAGAIGRAIAAHRNGDDPLLIGSVKTNIGHLEAGAGLAGLVKVVLSLQHRAVPASLHFRSPNPNIPFSDLNLKVASEYTPLPANGAPMVMGVNSFGFGGANAHAILREYRTSTKARPARRSRSLPPLFISARSQAALQALSGAYADKIEAADSVEHYDIAYTAAQRRQQHNYRLAVPLSEPSSLVSRLRDFAENGYADGAVGDQVVAAPARVALLFSGNGSQWPGMGRRLLRENRVFRRAVEEVDALLQPLAGFSVVDELRTKPDESRLPFTEVAQPALFAVQVGVLKALLAKGLQPDAAFGHSVGEITAAYAAGALSLEQAALTIYARSAAQAPTRGLGRMAAVAMSPSDVAAELAALDGEVELAAVNSPRSVTLSGTLADLEALKSRLEARGVFFRILDLDYAFHSRFMDGVCAPLSELLAELKPTATRLPYVSTVTGTVLDGKELGAGYWWDNVRQPVRLDRATETLASEDAYVYLEIGPNPILQSYIQENLSATSQRGRPLPTLKKDDDGESRLMEAVCASHVLGAALDPKKLFPRRGRCVSLPSYPWQRESHWYPPTDELTSLLKPHREHPLLGFSVPHVQRTWENQIDTVRFPYLADHVVGGAVVFPASAFIEMALAAAAACPTADDGIVEELEIRTPMVLVDGQPRVVRFSLADDHGFTIRSRVRFSNDQWTLHVVGRLASPLSSLSMTPAPISVSTDVPCTAIEADQHYDSAADLGLRYGAMFRGIVEVRPLGEDRVLARIEPPAALTNEVGDYHIHPVPLDACLQSLLGILSQRSTHERPVAYLPQRLGRLRVFSEGVDLRFCKVTVRKRMGRSIVADFKLADASGAVVAEMTGFRFRRMPLAVDGANNPSLYEFRAVLKPSNGHEVKAPLPSPTTLSRQAAPAIERDWQALRRAAYYQQVVPLLDALIAAYGFEALRKLGATGDSFTLQGLIQAAGISEAHVNLLQRLLVILQEDGIAVQSEGEWRLPEQVDLPDATAIWRRMLADFPECLSELTLVGRCGMHLTAVLRGELEAASLLAPTRGVSAVEHFYTTTPTVRVMRTALRAMVSEIVRRWPSNRRLRILEIPSDSIMIADTLLQVLPGGQCDYVIAAPDDATCAHLTSAFAEVPHVNVTALDIEGNLLEQETPREPFEIVIATNVSRVVEGIPALLGNVRRLLATDGLLFLQEQGGDRLTDFVFGVEPQWWQRYIPGGDSAATIGRSPGAWQAALAESGLQDIVPITEPVPVDDARAFVLVARNPSRVPGLEEHETDELRRFLLVSDISGDSRETAERVAESLLALGHRVVNVRVGNAFAKVSDDEYVIGLRRPEDVEELCAKLESEDRICAEVIHLAGYSMRGDLSDSDPMAVQEQRCATALNLVKGILASGWSVTPRLWLVTCRAMAPACDCQDFFRQISSQAPLWGFGRVLMNEHPELRCKLVDLHVAEASVVAARALVSELRVPNGEDEVILTVDRRYVMRAIPATLDMFREDDFQTGSRTDADIVRLDYPTSGFDQLQWQRNGSPVLAPDEIAIRTRATGLNFRDVMLSMGMLPDEAVENGFAGANLGMECAGDVVAVGSDVHNFKPSERVVCFAPSSFASHVVTKASAAARMPAEWTYEEAAGVPVAFFTAYYALHYLGGLRPNDKILIHGAAGGVGLAALQYARHCGAEIFATAGSEEKRDFLRLLGVDHVLDSRSLVFADEILSITNGEGVDIVLNSLSGEAVGKNLEVLRPFGRLLELGKRDYYENAKIGLRPFRNNIAYFGIDVDQLFKERPELAGRLLKETMDLFAAGALWPLPHRVFSYAHVADAFRHMQQSRHVGKIVVAYDDQPVSVRIENQTESLSLRPDSTYVIAGGLGGFGLATAQWMANKGARNIALLGRSGAVGNESQRIIADLEAAGVQVYVAKVDICDDVSLGEVFKDIENALPPVRGIVHAAMVLDDALLQNLEWEGFSRVLNPKVSGAWNLHRQSLGMSLDFFVLYSSATTSVGNPGQANYVAANVFLESLVNFRRSGGLPGLAVCWGPIEDVGYLARNETTKNALTSRLGGQALTVRAALRTLERLMLADRSGLAVANLDWHKVARVLPATRAPKFSLLTRGWQDDSNETGLVDDIQSLIRGMSDEQIQELTTTILLEQVARVLRMPVNQVEADRSVFELGMDSLMAVELQVAVESQFGVSIPAMAMNEETSIAKLAGQIAKQLSANGADDADVEPGSEHDFLASLSSRHGEGLSSEELEVLAGDVAESRGPVQ
jgi:acyl transferase domain-containing protein/NADPH:quinone reductase-like Zn-dependent oxidoreductase/acyl carrier protein